MTTLEKKGYQIFKLSNSAVVADLKKCVHDIDFEFSNNLNREICNYDTSLFETDLQKKQSLFNSVKSIFSGELQAILPGFKPLMINYWTKKPGNGEVEIHQNWSHIDESKNRSYTIWIPLQNCDHENGTMHVIPYSHLLFKKPRGLNSSDYLFRGLPQSILYKLHIEIKLQFGEFVVFDDALLHYTSANKSYSNRDAVQLVVVPENAQAKFYHKNWETGMIDEYNADDSFYRNLSVGSASSKVSENAVRFKAIPDSTDNRISGILKMLFNRTFVYHASSEEYKGF